MYRSAVTCHNCRKTMVPRTTYARSIWGTPYPCSNHCPFCLSSNWDGTEPSFGMKLFWLLGVGLGVLATILTGAYLFKMQYLVDIKGT